jgi:hypothetical protein
MTMNLIDFEIPGSEIQFVEVEPDPGESALSVMNAMQCAVASFA